MNPHETLDPICDMVVDIAGAGAKGLVTEWQGDTYAFCSAGCKKRFEAEPARYAIKVRDWLQRSERAEH